MWRNNFKVAIRTLQKDKLYSFISVMGLAVSIAFCLLMAMYLRNEKTYDLHHDQAYNIHRLVFDSYDNMGAYATTPLPIGPALEQDFPEIEAMTRLSNGFKSLVRFNNNKFFETISFVDTGVVDIFKMDFIVGNPETILSQPNQIVLSESAAKKYFGNGDPVGQTLEIGSSGSLNSTVTGVFKDFPQNTHIRFDIAMPFSTFEKVWGPANLWEQMPSNYTYFRLIEGQSPTDFAAKLPAFAEKHVGKEVENLEQMYKLNIQAVPDIHLQSHLQREAEPNGELSSLMLLGFIALLVLIIACINYVNYATARFSKRTREVSVRKVIGAERKQLISQFLLETFIIALVAGLMAFLLAQLLVPAFNSISGKIFAAADLNHFLTYASLGVLVMLITFGAGIFPALFLSGFQPIEALKGQFSNLSLPNISRKYLVTTQFAASIILMISTMVVYTQMDYARQQFQPADQDKVVLFQINSKINEKYDVLKEEVLKQPGVISVTAGSNMPTFYGDSWPVRTGLEAVPVQTENYTIENDFIETLGYELLAGRDLDKNRTEDVEGGFILNETAVQKFGFTSPEEAVGETLYWGSDEKKKGNVVGVVKDFHFQSLHNAIEPALIQFSPYSWMTSGFVALRVDVSQLPTIQKTVQEVVTSIDPRWLADVKFLDDNFEKVHQKDIQQGKIFGAFALLAILISCLGLLGLAAFAAERRTKEIGIRKVLGASVANIIGLLSKEFLTLVVIAFVIAAPLAFYLMDNWLQDFAYRIDIQWSVFALAGSVVVILAFLTVSFQSLKAALTNPVDSLRSE